MDDAIKRLIAHVAADLDPEVAQVVNRQAAGAVVMTAKPTMIDVEVPGHSDLIPLPDGPLPIAAAVIDHAGNYAGEILIWIRAGRLIGLEQAWVTDEAPTRWPSVEEVRLR